jgi:hypothetical protein
MGGGGMGGVVTAEFIDHISYPKALLEQNHTKKVAKLRMMTVITYLLNII